MPCKDTGTQSRSDHSCPDSKVKVTLTLWDPVDYIVRGILQARILWWAASPFSRGSSQPRDRTQVSLTAGGFQEPLWKSRPNCPAPPSGYTEKCKSPGAKRAAPFEGYFWSNHCNSNSVSSPAQTPPRITAPAFGALTGWACLGPPAPHLAHPRLAGLGSWAAGSGLCSPASRPTAHRSLRPRTLFDPASYSQQAHSAAERRYPNIWLKKKGKKIRTERRKEGC